MMAPLPTLVKLLKYKLTKSSLLAGGLGAVADFELALRCKGIDTGDVMVF